MLAHALTDIGKNRKVNQDYVWETTRSIGNFPSLFVLADGMGGPRGGDYASKYMVGRLCFLVKNDPDTNIIKVLRNSVQKINREIYETSLKYPELSGMGTTVVASCIDKDKLVIANVGDSRLYCVREGIEQITRDHSYVEEQVALGLMVRDSDEYRRYKHLLTRAVGVESRVDIDIFERALMPGELVLMCSDGLSNMVDDDAIFSVISEHEGLAAKSAALIDIANNNGGNDNIAVILINPELD